MLKVNSYLLLISLVCATLVHAAPNGWGWGWPSNRNPCSSSPCVNGGYCVTNGWDFRCQCKPDTIGVRCENFINPCWPNFCQKGASCQVISYGTFYSPGRFHCNCPMGYTGSVCQYWPNYNMPNRKSY